MESVQWKVDGMSCTNCALSIHKYLQTKGISEPKVNFMEGEVQFDMPENITKDTLIKGIQGLGYKEEDRRKQALKKSGWIIMENAPFLVLCLRCHF